MSQNVIVRWLRDKHFIHSYVYFKEGRGLTLETAAELRGVGCPEHLIESNLYRICAQCRKVQVADVDGWCGLSRLEDEKKIRDKLTPLLADALIDDMMKAGKKKP